MGFTSTILQGGANETEIEYMQRVVDTLCALDSRITCNTTAAAQYEDLTTDYTATFDIDIDGEYQLRLKRARTNGDTSGIQGCFFSIIVDGNEYCKSSAAPRLWSNQTKPTQTVGTGYYLKIAAFIDDEHIFIWIGGATNTSNIPFFPSGYSTGMIIDNDDKYYASGVHNSNLITEQSFYKCEDASAGFMMPKALNYIDAPGTISYLQNLDAPLYSNGSPAKFATGLVASSTRTLGESLFFDGKSYLAIGTNILIENPAS